MQGKTLYQTVDNNESTPPIITNNLGEKQKQALLNAVNSDDDSTRERTFRNLQELCSSVRAGQERTTGINQELIQKTSP